MPMLTGTLITAAGFLPIGMAQVDRRRVHLRDLRGDGRSALVISWLVSVYFVPYLGTLLLKEQAARRPASQPHELFDTPFYSALPRAR